MPQVNPGKDDLAITVFRKSSRFRADFFRRSAPQIRSRRRNDAIRASDAAPVLNLHVGAAAFRQTRNPLRDNLQPARAQKFRHAPLIDDDLRHMRKGRDALRIGRRVAPAHDDLGVGEEPGKMRDKLATLRVALRRDGTRVD